MNKELDYGIYEVAKRLGWSCSSDDSETEFRKGSPAGEDFGFYIENGTTKEIVQRVREYSDGFDADNHIKMWISVRQSVSGVPSVRTLVHDAEAIEKMLDELAEALEDAELNNTCAIVCGKINSEKELTFDYIEVKTKDGKTVCINPDKGTECTNNKGEFKVTMYGVCFEDMPAANFADDADGAEVVSVQVHSYEETSTTFDMTINSILLYDGRELMGTIDKPFTVFGQKYEE